MPHSEASLSQASVKDEPVDHVTGITSSVSLADGDGDGDGDEDDDVDMLDTSHAATDAAAVKKNDGKLDDLFADDESDQEFPSSAPVVKVAGSSSSSSQESASSTDMTALNLKASDPEVMRSFYQRLFPWRQLFHWLNHSPTPTADFGNREFAFTLQNEAYLRYQSFATADLLRKDVLRLMPSRFEIGPVYTASPRDRKTLRNSSAFKPLAKELCFDIDLTDYDDIRTCCDKANICKKCWAFMTMAIKVIDVALRDDFGFRHIIWVYSGRRGVHAWVCDKKARTLDDQKRRAIAGYLEVVRGGAQSGKKVNVRRPLHPHLARSLNILKTHFLEDVLSGQDPWCSSERADRLLQLLPDRTLNESLRRKWESFSSSSSSSSSSSWSKWADIDAVAKTGASKTLDARALMEAKQDIVLEYTYPRLDMEVSKKLNHLLKSPFVVHPGTGRVCVPIDTSSDAAVEAFDPLRVPTVQSLLAEIDAWKGEGEGEGQGQGQGQGEASAGGAVADWEKTSLKPHVEYFRSFVAGIMRDERDARVKRERGEESMEF